MSPARRTVGRRPGDSGTRAAIGEAARAQFADFGYHGATIRGIAAAAEVDPALVHHYYGSKEALFAAAMQIPVVPSEVLTAALSNRPAGDTRVGAHLVKTALTLWESAAVKDTFLGLLRSAVTSDQASVMLREFISDTILGHGRQGDGPERAVEPRGSRVPRQPRGHPDAGARAHQARARLARSRRCDCRRAGRDGGAVG